MLSYFFESYFKKYAKSNILDIAIPTFKYLINKRQVDFKKSASFIYYLISDTIDLPMIIINSILDEIILKENFDNYNLISKWIIILLEFNVHQFNLDQEKITISDSNSSVGLLIIITDKIKKIFVS
jgi:hypothetical protein